MSVGVEATLLMALINAHTADLSEATARRLFTDITLGDIAVKVTASDLDTLAFTGDISSSNRRFTAPQQTWTASHLSGLIKNSLRYTGTRDDFLADDGNLIYVDTDAVLIPLSSDAALTITDVYAQLTFATGYDFSDIGTLPHLHDAELVLSDNITAPPSGLEGRLAAMWIITGGIVNGTVYFIKPVDYVFGDEVDLGVLPRSS